jgi:hypothetical protein
MMTTEEAAKQQYPDIIPEKVYRTLPHLLREPCARFTDAEERDLFLFGALGVISGMLPQVQGLYFGAPVGANLFCFIIGNYGTGKGALKWAYAIGDAAHRHRIKTACEQQQQYTRAMMQYRRQQALYTKGKLQDPPEEPAPPAHLKLYIPANTTKTAVMQLLKENDGHGIIFETEGDTLADMLRQDYGNFSDILRKAFHHEPVSFFRRADNEDVAIQHPALSVVLSGTYDQLLRLVPSIDNGLYSRFCYYILQGTDDFKNPFSVQDSGHSHYFSTLGETYLGLYKQQLERSTPCQFILPVPLQRFFMEHMAYMKEYLQTQVSDELNGAANRMGIMCYRIAMILTALRHYELGINEDNMVCLAKTWKAPCSSPPAYLTLHGRYMPTWKNMANAAHRTRPMTASAAMMKGCCATTITSRAIACVP